VFCIVVVVFNIYVLTLFVVCCCLLFVQIHIEEVQENNTVCTMQFRGENLDKKDLFGKSDPFLVISRVREGADYVSVCVCVCVCVCVLCAHCLFVVLLLLLLFILFNCSLLLLVFVVIAIVVCFVSLAHCFSLF
jgi:hypothetical protein